MTIDPLSLLSNVEEETFPLSEQSPIWVRWGRVTEGPPCPAPQRHPFFEFGIQIAGTGIELVGSEQAERRAGDLLLAAPGVPHWLMITEYPIDFVTVFFLPSLLIKMGPDSVGLHLLRRFTTASRISERLVRPTQSLVPYLTTSFREMAKEFDGRRFGRELKLSTLLLDMLLCFVRWEQEETKQDLSTISRPHDWTRIHKALEYLRNYHGQPIYGRDLAAAVGITEIQLKTLFRNTLGMTWLRYLQSYRIQQAAILLNQTDRTVLEVCLSTGFDTISNFNAAFRTFTGTSPREFRMTSHRHSKD